MQAQLVQAPIHTPEQVEEIVREAHRIADNWTATDEWRLAIFHEACALLAQRATAFMPVEQVPLTPNHMAMIQGKH